jgi:hypothetical protein
MSMWDVVAGTEKLLRQAILNTPHK